MQRLADQRVGERPGGCAVRQRADEVGAGRALERVEDRLPRRGAGRLEEREVELRADHRGGLEDVDGGLAEPVEPAADHLAHALRHAEVAERGPAVVREGAGLEQVAQHLLDEERVAAGLVLDRGAQPGAGLRADPGGDQARGGVPVEPGQRDPLDEPVAPQVGERAGERVPAAELGLAVGADDHDPGRAGVAQHVGEQPQRRQVGPVQVVEREQHRPAGRFGEGGGDGLEQAQPRAGRVARRRRRRTAAPARHPRRRAGAAPRRTAGRARRPPPASGRRAPWRRRRERRAASSASRRVLPMPGSPLIASSRRSALATPARRRSSWRAAADERAAGAARVERARQRRALGRARAQRLRELPCGAEGAIRSSVRSRSARRL